MENINENRIENEVEVQVRTENNVKKKGGKTDEK